VTPRVAHPALIARGDANKPASGRAADLAAAHHYFVLPSIVEKPVAVQGEGKSAV
jgi:hypothetical protein